MSKREKTLQNLNLQTDHSWMFTRSRSDQMPEHESELIDQIKLAVDYLLSSEELVEIVRREMIPRDWVNVFIGPVSTVLDDATVFLYELFHISEVYAEQSVW